MSYEYIPYGFAIATSIAELAKASVKKSSVLFLLFSVVGFIASFLGGVSVIVFLRKADWWIITLISVLCSVFYLLNGKILFSTVRDWDRRRTMRNQVPSEGLGYKDCIKTGSLNGLSKANLWDSLLKEILRCGILTDLTLVQCLGEIYKGTCPGDLESCREAMSKLQALILAADCSGVSNSGKIVGEYMCAMRIALSRDGPIKQCDITWDGEVWKVTFPEVYRSTHPEEAVTMCRYDAIDYTYMDIITPASLKIYTCELCPGKWSHARRWYNFFMSFSKCKVCGIFVVSKQNDGINSHPTAAGSSSSDASQERNDQSAGNDHRHTVVTIPSPSNAGLHADSIRPDLNEPWFP